MLLLCFVWLLTFCYGMEDCTEIDPGGAGATVNENYNEKDLYASRGNCKLQFSEMNTPMLTSAVRTSWSRHEEKAMIKVQFRDCEDGQSMRFRDHTVALFACTHPKSVRPKSANPTTTNPALIWAASLQKSKGLDRPITDLRPAAKLVKGGMPSIKKFVWSSVVLGMGFTDDEARSHHVVFNAGKVNEKKRQTSTLYTTINSQKWGASEAVFTVMTKEDIELKKQLRDKGAIAMVLFGKGDDNEHNIKLQGILDKMRYEDCDAKKFKKMMMDSNTKPICLDGLTLEILQKSVVHVLYLVDSAVLDDGEDMLNRLSNCLRFLPPDQQEYEVLSVDLQKLSESNGIIMCPDESETMRWVYGPVSYEENSVCEGDLEEVTKLQGVVPAYNDEETTTVEPLGEDEGIVDLDVQTNNAFEALDNESEGNQDLCGPPQCKKQRLSERGGHDLLQTLIEYAACTKKEIVSTKKEIVDMSDNFKKYCEERKADCGQTGILEIIAKEKERRQKEVLEVKWSTRDVQALSKRARLFDPSRAGAFFKYAYQPFYRLMTKSSDPEYLHLQCHVCKRQYDLSAGNVEPLQRPSHLNKLATSEGVDLNPSQAKNLNERLRTHPTSVQHIANEKKLLEAAKDNGGVLDFMDDVLQQTPTERMIRTVFMERMHGIPYSAHDDLVYGETANGANLGTTYAEESTV